MKTIQSTIIVLLSMIMLSSCEYQEEPSIIAKSFEQKVKGRFDTIPFKWDYSFSTDSSVVSDDGLLIYPVKVDEEKTSRANYSNQRPTLNYTEDILITDPNIIYVGAAFPEEEFGRGFAKEILYPRNPIDIYTNFPDPYIGSINKETGSLGYKLFMKNVLHSTEYKTYLQAGMKESLEFMCSEIYSYSDIEHAFSSNAGLGKIFAAKVQSNSHKTNIKSRLLGQLVSKNFTVSMDVPINGFFKDRNNDNSSINPVYVRSLTYGKIALLAIESEYSFEEVKKAIEAGIKFKIFSTGGNYTNKDVEILQKSTITIYVISDNTSGNVNEYFSSLDEIKNAFTVSYTDFAPGLPIICKGFYTKDNSVYKVATGWANQNDSDSDKIGSKYGDAGSDDGRTPNSGGRTGESGSGDPRSHGGGKGRH